MFLKSKLLISIGSLGAVGTAGSGIYYGVKSLRKNNDENLNNLLNIRNSGESSRQETSNLINERSWKSILDPSGIKKVAPRSLTNNIISFLN